MLERKKRGLGAYSFTHRYWIEILGHLPRQERGHCRLLAASSYPVKQATTILRL